MFGLEPGDIDIESLVPEYLMFDVKEPVEDKRRRTDAVTIK